MAQGEDEALLASIIDEICEAILAVAHGIDSVEPPAGSAVQAAE
jgi:hypothetical protein